MEELNKEIKINRILIIISIALIAIFMAAFGYVCYNAYNFIKELIPYIEVLSKIDFDSINQMMGMLSEFETLDIKGLSEGLNSIDFDTVAKLVDSIDIDEINEAMEGLSKASEVLEQVSEKIAPLMKWFK